MKQSRKNCLDSIEHIISELAGVQFQFAISGRDSELIEEQALAVMNELLTLSTLVGTGSKCSGISRAINPYDRRKVG